VVAKEFKVAEALQEGTKSAASIVANHILNYLFPQKCQTSYIVMTKILSSLLRMYGSQGVMCRDRNLSSRGASNTSASVPKLS